MVLTITPVIRVGPVPITAINNFNGMQPVPPFVRPQMFQPQPRPRHPFVAPNNTTAAATGFGPFPGPPRQAFNMFDPSAPVVSYYSGA